MSTFLLTILLISLLMIINNLLVPVWLRLFGVFSKKEMNKAIPVGKISVIIPVYNEEDYIIERLNNIKDALANTEVSHEVLVGSDGSTDKTVQAVENFIKENRLRSWQVFDFPNDGKGQTINKLVSLSKGEIIISTDADVAMDAGAVSLIVDAFEADDRLGCLSSVPAFDDTEKNTQSFYWHIEMKIREAQSRLGKLIVVTGWLYAFRKNVFRDIPYHAMADDLWVPLAILLQGSSVRHDARLKAYSEKTDEATEVRRRRRVISGGADIVRRLFGKLIANPGLFLVVFLHKINRWLLPVWILLAAGSSLMLAPRLVYVYAAIFVLLLVVLKPRRLFYLLVSAFSPMLALFALVKNKDLSKWEHTRVR